MAVRTSKANGIKKAANGTVTGTLISVDITESELTNSKTGEIEQTTQLEWVFEVESRKAGKNIHMHTWTGLVLNTEKNWYPEGGDKPAQFNKLTQLALAAKVVSLDEIKKAEAGEDIDLPLEDAIGKTFEFKTQPKKGKPGLDDIVISTVKMVDEE